MNLDGKVGAGIFALVSLVCGCAVAPDVREQAVGIASKTSCCASEQTFPDAAPVAKEQETSLQANSPLYDFGTGLAPFARLTWEPACRLTEHPFRPAHTRVGAVAQSGVGANTLWCFAEVAGVGLAAASGPGQPSSRVASISAAHRLPHV
jgi:hypothetical protein